MRGRLYLVTGGAGFIGSHLVERLAREGCRVRVLDDFSTGSRANVEGLPTGVEVVEGDVRDADIVSRAVQGCAGVFHLAAIPSVVRSIENPRATHAVNVDGTLNVLEAARAAGERDTGGVKVVYAGSSSAYGDSPTLPKQEDMREDPRSPYAVSKLVGEHYVRVYARVFGLRSAVLRFFNVYGPRQAAGSPYTGVVALFAKALLRGGELRIDGDGRQTRDFTYISDAVEAAFLAMARPAPPGTVFNVARGERAAVLDVAGLMRKITEAGAPLQHGPPRPGDVRDSLADISRTRELLGYLPRVSLEEGLRMTVEWYRKVLA